MYDVGSICSCQVLECSSYVLIRILRAHKQPRSIRCALLHTYPGEGVIAKQDHLGKSNFLIFNNINRLQQLYSIILSS